ncbi:MAG: ATP--guanido phosphotransferase [Christensenellaceae bacterium]|jgi:protein arginine kinase|nr:ATP--guanido phosphotransferase [Christensenellaceae bacterium]
MQVSDVVLSCRVRLARNLSERHFVNNQSAQDAAATVDAISSALPQGCRTLRMAQLPAIERLSLVERHLASAELIANESGALVLNEEETLAVMINEEDHLRIQGILPTLDLGGAYALCKAAEDAIEQSVPLSFDERLGYLTACPTNLGTGLRASAMLHLAGLALSGKLEELLRRIGKLGIAVRGFYGEGSAAPGYLYQISNQYTLGLREEEILSALTAIIKQLAGQELLARKLLLEHSDIAIRDVAARSLGLCRYAYKMSMEECMQHISRLKLGISLGLVDYAMQAADLLIIGCQSAQLCIAAGRELTDEEESVARASFLRNALKEM